MARTKIVGVVGPAECDPIVASMAEVIGRGIAGMGAILLCGGRTGVMEAACRGAQQGGGLTVGVLPSDSPDQANPYVDVPIATGIGHARNATIAHSCTVLIAVGAGYGTLSEIAIALKVGTPVVTLGSWAIPGVHDARDPDEALEMARRFVDGRPWSTTPNP